MVKTKSDATPFGRQISFVRDLGTLRDTREGPMTKTDAPLDVAIHGDGYFTIDTPAGQRYTRAGHFRLDENGMVVTAVGLSGAAAERHADHPRAQRGRRSPSPATARFSTENGVIGKLKVVDLRQ